MRKYLVALIFFFSVPLFAQQLWWVDTTATGNPGKKVFLGEWQGQKFNINYSPLPVKLVGGTVVTDTVNFTQLDSMTAVLLLTNIHLTNINANQLTQIARHTADSLNFVSMVADLVIANAHLADIRGSDSTRAATGNSEATQLLLLEQLQNRINLGGLQTYSVRRGDFTATPKVGGKSIAITGATFTPSYLNVAYAYIRNSSTGAFTILPNTDVRDSVAGTSIRWDDMATPFTSTDVVEVVFIAPEKTLDKANDAGKSIEQSPIWARYTSDNLISATNNSVGLVRYDYSGEGYNYQTIQLEVSASALSGVKLFATENDAASTTIETNWRDITSTVFGVDSLAFTTAQTVTYNISVPMQFKKWRIRVYYGHATNSVTAWIRRWF